MKKKKIEYTAEPIGDLKLVNDFLPPPEKLVLREETVKKRQKNTILVIKQ